MNTFTNHIPHQRLDAAAFEAAADATPSSHQPDAPRVPDYARYYREFALPIEPPAIDEDIVQAQASASAGSIQRVEGHHGDAFDVLHLSASGRCEGLRVGARRDERAVEAHLAALERKAADTPEFLDVPGAGTPWTTLAMMKFGCAMLLSAVLLGVGWMSLGNLVFTSGIPGLHGQWWKSHFWSLMPIAAAWVLKSAGGLFSLDRHLRRYTGFLHLFGVVLAVLWATLFCQEFGSGMAQTAEQLLALALAEHAAGPAVAAPSGASVLLVGLLGEITNAAALFLAAERIADAHRTPRREVNQNRTIVAAAIEIWSNHLTRINAIARELDGRLAAFAKARAVFLERARAVYELRRRGIDIYLHNPRSEAAAGPQP